MKVLVVSSSCANNSLLSSARDLVIEALIQQGVEVLQSPLDEICFHPFVSMDDYTVEEKSNISKAQLDAYPSNYSEDILAEMNKIRAAEYFIIISGRINGMYPTRFLGWLQRVFLIKFAVYSVDIAFRNKKKMLMIVDKNEEGGEIGYRCLINSIKHHFQLMKIECLLPFSISNTDDLAELMSKMADLSSLTRIPGDFNYL
jgi:putative NADPH-quinone reductase